MGRKKVKVLLIVLLSSLILGGCKSKMTIQKELGSIISEYQGEDIWTYLEKKHGSNVIISSNVTIEKETEGLVWKGVVLYYYGDEKVAYGQFFEEHILNKESKILYEIPVKLDNEGYHIKSGFEQYVEEIEEIKNFKFMFETVKLTQKYLNTLELIKSDYNVELPSYSQIYGLSNPHEEIKKFIEKKGLNRYGDGYSIEFSKGLGNAMILTIDEKASIKVDESFNYSVSPETNDYKGKFEEVTSEDGEETTRL